MAASTHKWDLSSGFKKFVKNKTKSVEDPPGYIAGPCERQGSDQAARAKRLEITQAKAMAMASSPAKNVLMTAFMMYMTGTFFFFLSNHRKTKNFFFHRNFDHFRNLFFFVSKTSLFNLVRSEDF